VCDARQNQSDYIYTLCIRIIHLITYTLSRGARSCPLQNTRRTELNLNINLSSCPYTLLIYVYIIIWAKTASAPFPPQCFSTAAYLRPIVINRDEPRVVVKKPNWRRIYIVIISTSFVLSVKKTHTPTLARTEIWFCIQIFKRTNRIILLSADIRLCASEQQVYYFTTVMVNDRNR